jgi:hypothetical protein
MTDDQRRALDDALLDLEAANAQRGLRILLAGALTALVGAGLALVLDWQTGEHDLGVTARTGYDATPTIAWLMGAIAVVLLAVAYWRVDQPAWSGWAVLPCGIAGVACLGALHAGNGAHRFGGPAGWLALAGFAVAAVLAGLAAAQRASRRPAPAEKTAEALRRIQRLTTTKPSHH